MSNFSLIAKSLDKELVEYKEQMLALIKELNVLELSDKSDEEKLIEIQKIREKMNKVRLEIDIIRKIVTMMPYNPAVN